MLINIITSIPNNAISPSAFMFSHEGNIMIEYISSEDKNVLVGKCSMLARMKEILQPAVIIADANTICHESRWRRY